MSTLTDLDAEVAELRERLAEVYRMHRCCDNDRCSTCHDKYWPCPTVRAIDGYR